MIYNGKKIGKFEVSTVLARYILDVRVSVEDNQFVVLVPKGPGETIDPKKSLTYERFSASTLQEVKSAIVDFLKARDTTKFVDVIEYTKIEEGFIHHGASREDFTVCFDFRVARVSEAKHFGTDRPKLEIDVSVNEQGIIVESLFNGERIVKPESYNSWYDRRIPFTKDRWLKCRAIRDGIVGLRTCLKDLLDDEKLSGERLDALDVPLMLEGKKS